jgi:hypothetical protein
MVGANYVDLEHDCNPFEPCVQCGPLLADTGWAAARVDQLQALHKIGS